MILPVVVVFVVTSMYVMFDMFASSISTAFGIVFVAAAHLSSRMSIPFDVSPTLITVAGVAVAAALVLCLGCGSLMLWMGRCQYSGVWPAQYRAAVRHRNGGCPCRPRRTATRSPATRQTPELQENVYFVATRSSAQNRTSWYYPEHRYHEEMLSMPSITVIRLCLVLIFITD